MLVVLINKKYPFEPEKRENLNPTPRLRAPNICEFIALRSRGAEAFSGRRALERVRNSTSQ